MSAVSVFNRFVQLETHRRVYLDKGPDQTTNR